MVRLALVAAATGVVLAGCGGTAVPPPHFRVAADWHVGSRPARTCHVRHASCVRALAWAATVPCADCGADEPLRTLAVLPSGGIVIQLVSFRIGDTYPPRRLWPTQVRPSDVESGYVGLTRQPLFDAMRAGRTGATDWSLLVWFGRAHPTAHQLARANAELRRASP